MFGECLNCGTDPSFRYKMPKVQTKIEGRGNGIRTCVTNMHAIAEALRRPATIISKYLGMELGAQSSLQAVDGRCIVMGAHSSEAVQGRIGSFVADFVLCPVCHLPETVLVSPRRNAIFLYG